MTNIPKSYSATGEIGATLQKRSLWARFLLDLKKSPYTARFGMVVIFFYIFVALFAPWLAPYGESQVFPARLGGHALFSLCDQMHCDRMQR